MHAMLDFIAGVAAVVREDLASWAEPGPFDFPDFWDIADDRTLVLAAGITGADHGYDIAGDGWPEDY